jgi:hypothetical protein
MFALDEPYFDVYSFFIFDFVNAFAHGVFFIVMDLDLENGFV